VDRPKRRSTSGQYGAIDRSDGNQASALSASKYSALIGITVAVFASGLIWAISPYLTGEAEPWDAEGVFYIAALLVAGAISGVLAPRPLWAHYFGSVIGQLTYALVFPPIGPLALVGVPFLLGYAVFFWLGAVGGALIRSRLVNGSKTG